MKKILTTLLFISTSVFANSSLYEIEIRENDLAKKEESVVKFNIVTVTSKELDLLKIPHDYKYETKEEENYISEIAIEENGKNKITKYKTEKINFNESLKLVFNDEYIFLSYYKNKKIGYSELPVEIDNKLELLKIPMSKYRSVSKILTLEDQTVYLIKESDYEVKMSIKKIKD